MMFERLMRFESLMRFECLMNSCQTTFKPAQTNFKPTQTNFKPTQTNFKPTQTNFKPTQTIYQTHSNHLSNPLKLISNVQTTPNLLGSPDFAVHVRLTDFSFATIPLRLLPQVGKYPAKFRTIRYGMSGSQG